MWKMALLGENMDVAQEAGNALVQLHLHLGPGLQQRMASVRKSFVGWVPACCHPRPSHYLHDAAAPSARSVERQSKMSSTCDDFLCAVPCLSAFMQLTRCQ